MYDTDTTVRMKTAPFLPRFCLGSWNGFNPAKRISVSGLPNHSAICGQGMVKKRKSFPSHGAGSVLGIVPFKFGVFVSTMPIWKCLIFAQPLIADTSAL
jgi:hypothetical protein